MRRAGWGGIIQRLEEIREGGGTMWASDALCGGGGAARNHPSSIRPLQPPRPRTRARTPPHTPACSLVRGVGDGSNVYHCRGLEARKARVHCARILQVTLNVRFWEAAATGPRIMHATEQVQPHHVDVARFQLTHHVPANLTLAARH